MNIFPDILNYLLVDRINLLTFNLHSIPLIKLFGVQPVFVLKFFGELFLLFLFSALISHILKIDKASRK